MPPHDESLYREVCEPQFAKLFAQNERNITVQSEWVGCMNRMNKLLEGNGRPSLAVIIDRFQQHIENEAKEREARREFGRRVLAAVLTSMLITIIGAAWSGYAASQASSAAVRATQGVSK